MSAGGDTTAAELRATYRLQLGTDLDFAAARALVPYLAELGVSHLYLSPALQARAGSAPARQSLVAASSDSDINRVWRDFHTASQHALLMPQG